MKGPILIPLDGSEFSEAALPWALEVSRRLGVGLDVVSVAEPIPTLDDADWNFEAERWVNEYVDHIVDECSVKAGGEVSGAGVSGYPLDRILRRADTVGASVLVAATHGRGPIARAWLGSVADGLLRTAPIPVLLVRPAEIEGDAIAPDPGVAQILVPIDGSADSEAALELAATWAHAFDAKLHVLHVVMDPNEIALRYLPRTTDVDRIGVDEATARAKDDLSGIVANLGESGLDVAAHVTGDAHGPRAILRTAQSVGADLLVMATHGRGGIQRALLGSVTDKVVRSADIPVLVTHIPDAGS